MQLYTNHIFKLSQSAKHLATWLPIQIPGKTPGYLLAIGYGSQDVARCLKVMFFYASHIFKLCQSAKQLATWLPI